MFKLWGGFPYISAAIFPLVFTLPHFSLTYILSKAFIMFWQNFIRSNSAIFLLIGQIIPLTDQLQSVLLSIVIFFVIVLGVPVYIWGFFPRIWQLPKISWKVNVYHLFGVIWFHLQGNPVLKELNVDLGLLLLSSSSVFFFFFSFYFFFFWIVVNGFSVGE